MTTPIGPRKPRKQQAAEALNRIRITPEQARTAGSLGQVGTATGSLAGAALGAIVGAAAKHPAQGAGLGAGIGGALGGGSGAAAGLYAARPRKPKKAVLPKPPSPVAKQASDPQRTGDAVAGGVSAVAGLGAARQGQRARRFGAQARSATGRAASHSRAAGIYGRDAATNAKLSRAYHGFAESAASSPVTAHRRSDYLFESQKFTRGAVESGARARSANAAGRAALSEAKGLTHLRNRAAVTAAGIGVAGIAAGALAGKAAERHELQKNQRRESDGRFAAGGAALATAGAGVAGSGAYQQTRALANHTLATTEAHVKRNTANAAMGVASQLRGEHGEARRAFYRNAMGEADQAVHRANAAYKVATAGTKNRYLLGAGLITAGAGLAAGGHAHKKAVQKNFDESQVRRQRGQFAPKGGMTAVPGASKPRVSEDAQTKAARAGLVGAQAADIVGIKSAWHETRNAEKVGEGVKATLKYAGKRAAFPIVAGGLGATLLADHVMRNQQRKLQGTPVAKAADPLAARKKSTRETAATGAALVAAGEAGGLAASRRAAHHAERSTLAQRVATSGPNSPWLKGPMRQKASHIALESGLKASGMKQAARSARVMGRGYGGLVLGAGAVGMAAAHKASRPKTPTPSVSKSHTQEIAMPAPDVNELFSKARELAYESEVAKFEVETKRAAKTGAKWGAGIGATAGGISGAVMGGHLGGAKGAVLGGLSGAARSAAQGAVSYGAIGAGVGAIKAKKRINRTTGVAQP